MVECEDTNKPGDVRDVKSNERNKRGEKRKKTKRGADVEIVLRLGKTVHISFDGTLEGQTETHKSTRIE